MDDIEQARLKQLERCVPNIWDFGSYLYIGAGEYRHHFLECMKEKMLRVDIIEIDEDNCNWLMKNHFWANRIINDNIINFIKSSGPTLGEIGENRLREEDWYFCEAILWSHGVSCVEKIKGKEILLNMEQYILSSLLVNLIPFGDAGGGGNVSVWYPKDFEDMGYKTDTLGNEGEVNSNLLAWKYL